jgi:hypothetical protein
MDIKCSSCKKVLDKKNYSGWMRTNLWKESLLYNLDLHYLRYTREYPDTVKVFCPECVIIKNIIE